MSIILALTFDAWKTAWRDVQRVDRFVCRDIRVSDGQGHDEKTKQYTQSVRDLSMNFNKKTGKKPLFRSHTLAVSPLPALHPAFYR